MGDHYDKWFERGQHLGYEGQNLEEYIEKRAPAPVEGAAIETRAMQAKEKQPIKPQFHQ